MKLSKIGKSLLKRGFSTGFVNKKKGLFVSSVALISSGAFWTYSNLKIEAVEQNANGYTFPVDKLVETKPNRKSVVLLSCGSFNPPTNLHLQLLEGTKDYMEKTQDVDVILGLLSPVHDGYGKKGLLPSSHRLNFAKICTSDSTWIAYDDWESKQEGYSTTVKVLRHVDEYVKRNVKHPQNVRVMLVCGADLLESFCRPGLWAVADQEEILSKFGVAVLERGDLKLGELIYGNDLMFKHQKNIHVVPNLITNDISSTKIRQFIKRGYSIKYLTPRGISEYIKTNKLYE